MWAELLNIPRAVNRDRGWFKTRHSPALDVRKRMWGQAAPDGDPSLDRFGGDEEGWVSGCGDVLRDPLLRFRYANGCQYPVNGRAGHPVTPEPGGPGSGRGLPREWRLQIVPVGW